MIVRWVERRQSQRWGQGSSVQGQTDNRRGSSRRRGSRGKGRGERGGHCLSSSSVNAYGECISHRMCLPPRGRRRRRRRSEDPLFGVAQLFSCSSSSFVHTTPHAHFVSTPHPLSFLFFLFFLFPHTDTDSRHGRRHGHGTQLDSTPLALC